MESIREFEGFLQNEDMSLNTINSYTDTLTKFKTWSFDEYGINDLRIISSREIKQYREELLASYSPSSVNQKLSAIKTYYAFLIEKEEIVADPSAKVKLQKIEEHFKNQYFTRAEELSILNTAKSMGLKEYAIVITMLKTGVRVSELSSLKLNDTFLDEAPSILIKNSKGGKSRYIPLSSDVVIALRSWLELRNQSEKIYHVRSPYIFTSQRAQRLSPRGIQQLLNRIGLKCDIKIYPIRMRATFANNLIQTAGIPINILANLMGHTSVNTTQRYASPSEVDKRKYLEKLSEI